ncbi:MAG: hypothetical protein IMZ44_21380 [Planctomycetes bacterium]|nr:hypothetical protein [Planctomycetota bacterium]
MKPAAIIFIAVLALAAGFSAAADPVARPEAASVVSTDERAKLAEVEALFAAEKFGDVAEPARALLRITKDDAVKTGAARLIAESLRKKGDWRVAAAAYAKLAERYEKGSDDQIKATATGEVLLASPTGIYPPLEAAAANAEAAAADAGAAASTSAAASTTGQPAAANLGDDTYLARALACLASIRAEKLKARVVTIKRARTPQEAQAAFAALAEELRQARVLSDSLSADPEQAAAGAAGKQLADLGQQILATLNARLAGFQASIKRSALTLSQRKDMESYQALCTDLAKTEGSFQATAGKLNGLSSSSDAAKLRDESAQRQAEYAKLAHAFVPPPVENRDHWGGGGPGFGGGGPGGGGGGRRGG